MRSRSRRLRSAAATPRLNTSESPLAWLAQRRDKNGRPLISPVQLLAGERLRSDFTYAQMSPRVTTDYSDTPCAPAGRRAAPRLGTDVRGGALAAAERVRRALAAVGPELSGVLIDVCCHLKGLEETERHADWPQRTGKIVLQLALTSLARHYRLDISGPTSGAMRHWGAGDYRPAIDGPDAAPR